MKLVRPQKNFMTLASGLIFLVAVALALFSISEAGTLVCTVGTSCADTRVFKMDALTNAHAGLATSTYTQIVCCSGVTGLGTNCSGTYGVVGRLSADTNAHFEYGTSTTPVYDANPICLSANSVTIAYQSGNCTGYDTTIASVSNTSGTNAHVGDGSAYTTKVCGTASAPSIISVSVSDGAINYGVVPLSASSTTEGSDSQTVTNDGSGAETFSIKGQNTACPWTLAGTIGADQYKFEHSTTSGSTWGTITTGYTTIQTNVPASTSIPLDLRITMPSSTNCTTVQATDITILAASFP
jgi:hypothetical protein